MLKEDNQMKINKLITVGLMAISASVMASGSLTSVSARQRYPWNGLVDIDCVLVGGEGVMYNLTVSAVDKIGGTNLNVKTVNLNGSTAIGNPIQVLPGEHRLIWNADKDVAFCSTKVSISVTVSEVAKKFMVVDLRSGEITYMGDAPSDGWNDTVYKTSKMAFQRIEAQTFSQKILGLYTREVTISKPFYIAVHPLTEGQVSVIGGGNSSSTAYVMYPPTPYYWNTSYNSVAKVLRGDEGLNASAMWPATGHNCTSSSIIGLLRSKTKNNKFDMPTLAQMSLASTIVNWNSEGCLALDYYDADLDETSVTDPVGRTFVHYDDGSSMNHANRAFHTLVKAGQNHSRIGYSSTAPTRLCVYEAD
jgi:hypothetical protein